ncbi:2-C-methyl-D-erythritol 2,4-cyclodiphosphate synthase [Aquidulcibacter sp.]|uniref:2-C-methyl-D-erythritol 2,4-cyclodiphosphate synthase n=1 Tax=Aquidulcibacter sp. TaxID=2052990 RepID=UPI0025B7D62A|nr:2-C-methyl-D-erythritol 2,4-cyclodiphosphate synthase [Aquidulcibacter sp.]
MDPLQSSSPMAVAILVAGGTGTRAKQAAAKAGSSGQIDLPKQFQSLGGKPILRWSLEAFSRDPRFGAIVVVCAPEMRERVLACAGSIPVRLADAGQTRTQSVASGLQAAAAIGGSFCFIHDAARPGLSQTVLDHLFLALEAGADGAAPGLPIADALWLAPDGQVQQTQARDGLVRIQTPQAFRANLIQAAYAALPADQVPLDDVAVAKAFGANVQVVAGSPLLEKITWPEDFDRMTRLLAPQLLPRIGSGFDAHKFAEGTFVTLCGVEVPHSHGLAGHSDADVAWHCLADAIYGALSAGDIGRHFPPTDPQWRGAASSIFLAHAGEMVRAAGGSINHIDLTIICERPKIGPHREAMVRKTAELLGLRESQVSVKATTTEGMGFTGRAEGIAAQATATILLPADFGTALT